MLLASERHYYNHENMINGCVCATSRRLCKKSYLPILPIPKYMNQFNFDTFLYVNQIRQITKGAIAILIRAHLDYGETETKSSCMATREDTMVVQVIAATT